jgi:hypothetical protein
MWRCSFQRVWLKSTSIPRFIQSNASKMMWRKAILVVLAFNPSTYAFIYHGVINVTGRNAQIYTILGAIVAVTQHLYTEQKLGCQHSIGT